MSMNAWYIVECGLCLVRCVQGEGRPRTADATSSVRGVLRHTYLHAIPRVRSYEIIQVVCRRLAILLVPVRVVRSRVGPTDRRPPWALLNRSLNLDHQDQRSSTFIWQVCRTV